MPLNTLTGLLTHPVGPGGCPAADLLLGAVSLDLYLRGMRPPNFLTPEAKARAAETDTLTKRMIRVDLTTTRGRLIHQGFRTAPCFVQLFALWLKGWKGVEGFKGGLQFRKLFWCANIAILTGSALRLWCFRILGQYFTFELAVRDGQKVIRSALYGYVRHPSYIGGLMGIYGSLVSMFIANPLVPRKYLTIAAAVVFANIAWMTDIILTRIREEEFLQKELGEEYIQYMRDVRYRLIPWIW